MDILRVDLSGFATTSSQQRSWRCSWEGLFLLGKKTEDQESVGCQDDLDLLTAAFGDSHLCIQGQVLQADLKKKQLFYANKAGAKIHLHKTTM